MDVQGPIDPQGRDEDYEPTSPWWLSGTPLEAEHHRLMRRRSLPIPWGATTAAELDTPERARLAATWTRRSEAEYLAISTFSVLAIDLVAAMAPADVLSLCLRAGIDEIRHAEMCLRMVEIYRLPVLHYTQDAAEVCDALRAAFPTDREVMTTCRLTPGDSTSTAAVRP